ncbi:synaptotagmin-C isoform X1 [Tachysurus ichikawai]
MPSLSSSTHPRVLINPTDLSDKGLLDLTHRFDSDVQALGSAAIGHNEVIGMCRVGSDAEGPGREHWTAMLSNPRKPIEHWHQLVEEKSINTYVTKSAAASPKPHIVVDSPHSD